MVRALSLIVALNALANVALADPGCTACSWKIPTSIPAAARASACEDMYQSLCIDNRGINKSKRELEELNETLKRAVSEARQAGLVSLGFPSLNAAIQTVAESRGVEFVPNLSEKAKKYVFEKDFSSYVDESQIFKTSAECSVKLNTINRIPVDATNSASIKFAIENHKAFQAYSARLKLNGYYVNMPSAIAALTEKCEKFEDLSPAGQASLDLASLKSACSQMTKIRQRAIDIARQDVNENITAVKKKALVDELASALATTRISEPTTPAATELARLQSELMTLATQSQSACSNINASMSSIITEVRGMVGLLITASRPTVETLVNRFYSESRKAKTQTIFARVKTEANNIVARLTTDQTLRGKVAKAYSKLKVAWIDLPNQNLYRKIPGLKIEILNPEMQEDFGFGLEAFFDPSLSFFTTLNAFYTPDTSQGVLREDAMVAMMPSFLEYLDRNEFAFTNVFSHEVGHQIGPRLSKVNGHDLREAQKPVLKCLAEPDSIRLQDNQGDEAFADVVASEVLAKLASELPEEKRLSAIAAATESFCLVDATEPTEIEIEANHPNTLLRIGGIFGGNASLRKVMGCEASSTTYRTCSLEKK